MAFRHNFTFYLGFDPKQQGMKMDLDQGVSYCHSHWKHVIRGEETRFEVTGNQKLVLEYSFHQNTCKIMRDGFGVFQCLAKTRSFLLSEIHSVMRHMQ